MKEDKALAIRALAEVFVQRHGDRFAVLNGRWWHLDEGNRWTQTFVKETAFRLLQECAAFIPVDDEAGEWLLTAMGNLSTGNVILARAALLLRVTGLPGPGWRAPDPE